jgi:hypothetical protein
MSENFEKRKNEVALWRFAAVSFIEQKLRLQQPSLAISTLVRQLEQSGALEPGTFSLASVYRLLAITLKRNRAHLSCERASPEALDIASFIFSLAVLAMSGF